MNNQNKTCTKVIRSELLFAYSDVLTRLGWQVESTRPASPMSFDVAVTFTRPAYSTLSGDTAQCRLQRRFEAAAGEIEVLQTSMLESATRPSVATGLCGVLLMIFALYLIILQCTLPGVVLGILGTVCCAVPVFLYHRLYWRARQENEARLKALLTEIMQIGAEADKLKER